MTMTKHNSETGKTWVSMSSATFKDLNDLRMKGINRFGESYNEFVNGFSIVRQGITLTFKLS